jgi:acyl dehydratase
VASDTSSSEPHDTSAGADPSGFPVVLTSLQAVQDAVGEEIGPGPWFTVEQSRIDGFADDTLDHQWIHIDAERAKDGPYGTTIAHGFLTLSLAPYLANQLRRVENVTRGVNYGLNKVRFPAPVPSGARVRARMTIVECESIGESAVQLVSRLTIEVEGSDKPACVCDLVSRYYVD